MMAETLRLTTRAVEKNVDENALFHFDALFVSLAKHWPSLSEIPTSPAITFAHFLAISANIFAHFPPQFPTKNAIFHQISPFSQRFSDTGRNFSKKFSTHPAFFKKLARLSLKVGCKTKGPTQTTSPQQKEVKIMMNTQIIPNAFYGIQNFIDSLNAANAQGECTYTPKADYYETEKGFALEVEIPGVKKEDLDIQVEKNILTVKATRARKDEKFTYERSFRLADDIDTDNIKVSLENGILKFDLAKKAQAAARKISIA